MNWVYTATHEIGAGYHIFMGRAQDVAGNQEEAYEIARVLWLPKASPDIGGSSVATSAAAVRPGEQVAFTLAARNDGVQEALVTVSTRLPEGLSPVLDVLPADVEYDPDTRTLTWPDHLLWPGEHVQHIFLAEADAALPAMTLENEATFHAFWPNTDLLPPAERQPFLDREQTVTATTVITVDPALPADSDRTRPWALLTMGAQATSTGPQVELGVPPPTMRAGCTCANGRRIRTRAPGSSCRTAAGCPTSARQLDAFSRTGGQVPGRVGGRPVG